MITTSLLQLEHCYVTKLHIQSREHPTIEPGTEVEGNLDIQFKVRRHKTEPKFLIPLALNVTWPDDAQSYYEKIEITLESVFAFPPGTSEEEMHQYVPVLCISNLLGIVRGMIVQSTSLCPGGAYMLPLINLQELLKKRSGQEKALEVQVKPIEMVADENEQPAPPKPKRRTRRKKEAE